MHMYIDIYIYVYIEIYIYIYTALNFYGLSGFPNYKATPDGKGLSVPYITNYLAGCRTLLNASDDLDLILNNAVRKQKAQDK